MPSRRSASTSAGASVELTQMSAPRRSRLRGVATVARRSARPSSSRWLSSFDVRPGLRDADRAQELDPGDAGVDGRNRRSAVLEAPRRGVGRVVPDVHLEDVAVREPTGRRRPDRVRASRAARRGSASPAEPSRYFTVPAARKSTPSERTSIGSGARRLVGVEQHERAALVREPDDGLDVEQRSRAVGDVRHGDEQRVVVDRAPERVQRRQPALVGPEVHDAGAPQLLRVPDLPHGRELEVGRDHGRPPAVAHARRERAERGRERGGDRDLVRIGVHESGEARARGLGALDPAAPTARPSRPSRAGTPRTPRGRPSRARPASTS